MQVGVWTMERGAARWIRSVTSLGAAMIVGCSSGPSQPQVSLIRIEPAKAAFAPGDPVHVTVSNLDSATYVVNPCIAILERLDQGRWKPITRDRTCGDVGIFVRTGESQTMWAMLETPTLNLPEVLPAGVYRVSVWMGMLSGFPSLAASAPFRVAPARMAHGPVSDAVL